jgi:DNA-binding IclR family transcriptional regulator
MESVVLLAVLGQSLLNALIAAEAVGRSAADIPADRRGMTTSRLADATGIPRETVRRKLTALAEAEWVAREDGFWHLAMDGPDAVARGELAELDQRGVRRTARLFALLAPLVFDREQDGKSGRAAQGN